jgi:hypothetical protein
MHLDCVFSRLTSRSFQATFVPPFIPRTHIQLLLPLIVPSLFPRGRLSIMEDLCCSHCHC